MNNQDNISIQKYIAAVYSDGTKCNNQAILNPENKNYNNFHNHLNSFGRQNQKLSDSPSDLYRHNIALGISTGSMEKDNNPVQISEGDYVVYRIHVYNNDTKETSGDWIKIRDRFPSQATLIGVYGSRSDLDNYAPLYVPEYEGDDGTVREFKSSNFTWKDQTKFQWKINYSLSPKQYYELLVVVRFDNYSSKVLMNRAWVFDTEEKNVTNYRESDSDYVEFKNHSVSLEKYITWTNNDAGTNYVQYYDTDDKRDGHPIYNEEMGSDKKDNYKFGTPALVESGDKVNYSIKVTNTGKSDITVKEVIDEKANELTYISASAGNNRSLSYSISGNKIIFYVWDNGKNGVKLAPGASMWISVTFRVNTKENNKLIENYAHIDKIWDESGNNVVEDKDGSTNNKDKDWIKTKPYYVKLEKYIYRTATVPSAVVSGTPSGYESKRSGHTEYGTHPGTSTRSDSYKYNDPVTMSSGHVVQYAIKVTNEGNTQVFINEIKDVLPSGLEYVGKISGFIYGSNGLGRKVLNVNYNPSNGIISVTNSLREDNVLLNANEGIKILIMFRVTEPNISINVIKNTAEINKILNKNGYEVNDSCTNDNKDSDYIQLKDITISGTVWNDKVFDKEQKNYNAKYDTNNEDPLSSIRVALYRQAEDKNGKKYNVLISSKYTNSEGRYSFSSVDINRMYQKDGSVSNIEGVNQYVGLPKGHDYEKYIKAAKNSSNNRWNDAKEYYAYYIMFEYDGVTYTSTPDGKSYVKVDTNLPSNYQIDSNAREKLNSTETFDGYVANDRTSFNNKVNPVNNGSIIKYTTENQKGYIPKSTYDYDATNKLTNMNMYSSTNLIQLTNSANLEKQLQYVNLGLRGRDIFDLELTSDVDNVKVTVNNQQGVYNYTNKVNIRNQDVRAQNIDNGEDMAHTVSETMNSEDSYVEERQDGEGAQIGKTDITASKAYTKTNNYDYSESQGLQDVRVTYKITVTNASQTAGTATKVINYYDKVYEFDTVSITDKNGKGISYPGLEGGPDTSNSKYNKIIITPQDRTEYEKIMLEQGDSYYIYVTLKIKDIDGFREKLIEDNKIPTYNMAEIYEYKTKSYEGTSSWNKEFTRGLIDKDSAPGSATKKEVCHENNERAWIDKNISTVDYYFAAKNLNLLKYEDDTYATPTLYFTAVDRERKIEGTVFEDYTKIIDNNGDNKIRTKTGDGKQAGDEPGIKDAYVALFELVEKENVWYPRYYTTTDASGHFEFNGFLPGIYMIRYRYGNLSGTFLYNNNPNTKSYNGEDFQSTNNTGKYGDTEADWIYKLNSTPNYWYVYNEKDGTSTATDMDVRRKEVSTNVTNFTDEQMTGLNNARDGKTLAESNVEFLDKDGKNIGIMGATNMYAQTNSMIFTVEKATGVDSKGNPVTNTTFTNYDVKNMNFGIAEVPVTTIDLQKHVKSFTIKDSAGNNMIASAQIDKDNTSVTVNVSKIAVNRLDTVINVLSENLGMTKNKVEGLINYNVNKTVDSNIVIKEKVSEDQMKKLRDAMTQNSLAREINIVNAWKVTSGNVLAAPGTSVIDVSIEDEKLQGAKLEVTYEITCSMYAEKNFNNDAVTIPSITGMADYIDNDLSYNTNSNENNTSWTVTTRENVAALYKKAAEFKNETTGERLGTLDPEGTNYTTIVSANDNNKLLLTDCGTGTTEITLERVLSATDSSLGDIITSSIDSFEYDNNIEITGLDYENTKSESTGDFVYRDRVRTTDRYIILAGIQHDTATSETIAIHPPTGENNNMIYYIITVISIGILSAGIVLIKKYAIKK